MFVCWQFTFHCCTIRNGDRDCIIINPKGFEQTLKFPRGGTTVLIGHFKLNQLNQNRNQGKSYSKLISLFCTVYCVGVCFGFYGFNVPRCGGLNNTGRNLLIYLFYCMPFDIIILICKQA